MRGSQSRCTAHQERRVGTEDRGRERSPARAGEREGFFAVCVRHDGRDRSEDLDFMRHVKCRRRPEQRRAHEGAEVGLRADEHR